jgi:chromosomal replication initiation ATPase DnaA
LYLWQLRQSLNSGPRITCQEIFDRVESEFGEDPVTARSIKLYLCRKHSGEKLRTIGAQFGIGDAAVAQSCKRFSLKLKKDRKLREKMERFEERVFCQMLRPDPFLF